MQKRSGEWLLQPKIQTEFNFRFSLLGCVLFEYLQQQKWRSSEWPFQQNVQTNFTLLFSFAWIFSFQVEMIFFTMEFVVKATKDCQMEKWQVAIPAEYTNLISLSVHLDIFLLGENDFFFTMELVVKATKDCQMERWRVAIPANYTN